MKKTKSGRKLGRKKDQRKALKKGLARSLFLHEKIKTTEAKAKEVRPFAERCITKAKKGDLSSRRYLLRFFDKKTVDKLMTDLAKRYEEREGGYTRIMKLPPRKSDGAKVAFIELV